ncbi:cytochrome c4 [Variovorax sp. 770b2]|uniref:cytochrome c4 n=1 Tax=Variovorax sp. 770b2 TaxID=1566271 RepID=UPI0008ECF0DE|nr:cytochrome c4 [Variovorax sp. 770b2]SFQ33055.1 Cytochrome c5 [Variovorax sp. 770b2]
MNKTKQWIVQALVVLGSSAAGTTSAQIPDMAAGQKRAQVCYACHGENGVSKIPGTPHLAGQDRAYLVKALQSYRNGQRQDPTMTAMAKALSDADMANIATYFHLAVKNARGETLAALIQTNERLKPVGTVAIAETPVAAAARTADSIYGSTCTACHASGAAGAPKLGDKAAWSARIAQGNSKLYEHAFKGLNAMPARGSCSDCSDEELKKVVDYMIGKSK